MTILTQILLVIITWVYSHVLEYFILRLINTRDKKTGTLLNHYILSSRNTMGNSGMSSPDKSHLIKESKFLVFLILLHTPTIFISFIPVVVLTICSISYIMSHAACHKEFKHARRHYSWHYDHHMSGDASSNFSVRSPFLDNLLGTRNIYKGTKKEKIMFGKKLLSQGRSTRLAYAIRVAAMRRRNKERKDDEKKN